MVDHIIEQINLYAKRDKNDPNFKTDNLAASKVAKVLPLLNMLKATWKQFGSFHQKLSIDESMVPYRGLHSAAQFIKNKPVKFGYKL